MPFLTDYPPLKTIQEIARGRKIAVHLVGGFLRDYLLGIETKDFDFAVERSALQLARAFARRVKGTFILLDGKRGCARVVLRIPQDYAPQSSHSPHAQGGKGSQGEVYNFDFSDFRAKTFHQDLAHRDFTINTLSVDLTSLGASTTISQAWVDLRHGLADIKKRRIRRTTSQVFKEDPLRMMRAFSLKALLGFSIERQTLAQIRREKDLIIRVSCERIREELFKILSSDKAAATLKAMDKIGLLEKIIPQIKVMDRCAQGTYHHLDVWPHSLETVAQMENVFQQIRGDRETEVYLDEVLGGNHSRRSVMKLAALLHDIGKPDTRKKENGRVSFHGHEHVGKNVVRQIARMLKLSLRERYALEDMVRWHLRPGYLSNFSQPSERAVYRYFRDTQAEAASILLLSLADQKATRGPATTRKDQEHHETVCFSLVKKYFKKKNEKPFERLINGHDLIKTLKLKPSPDFGRILREVEEHQTLGTIKTKKQAVDLARKIAGRL